MILKIVGLLLLTLGIYAGFYVGSYWCGFIPLYNAYHVSQNHSSFIAGFQTFNFLAFFILQPILVCVGGVIGGLGIAVAKHA